MIEDQQEAIQSMSSTAADIQRWLLQAALKGSVSADRQRDLFRAGERLSQLARKLAVVRP